jgi:polyisoprenoid-binding protein YceI
MPHLGGDHIMMLRSRSLDTLLRRTLTAALVGLLAAVAVAHAQTRWTIDPKTSLAYWQISPNLNHLWATTCPGDSSWRPGEGRSSGWYINPKLKLPRTGYANDEDTVHVPLFPRHTVYPVCVEAARGEVVVADTVHWRGVVGTIAVQGSALVTGEMMRDVMMHQVLQTMQFPEIFFTVDSLVGITEQADTLRGSAVGTLTVRGQPHPTTAVVKVFPDAGGMRVLAKWRITAKELVEFTPKLHYLGLGVNTNIWHTFFMGADLMFRRATRAAN